jgi:hypothetical protein
MIAGTGVKMLQQMKLGAVSARRRGQDGSEEIHGAVVASFDVGHPAEMADVDGVGVAWISHVPSMFLMFLAIGNCARIRKSRSRHQIP